MGMHILVKSECCGCNAEIIEDLQVSHALFLEPNKIDLERGTIFSKGLGTPPLLENLQDNVRLECQIEKDVLKKFDRVIILNCIDYLYGHCLLKLLNIQRHLEDFPDYGIIAIVPQFLRWMVPEGVAEIWTINIPLKHALLCYPTLNDFVQREFDRFDEIYVSKAYSHPSRFDITKFTRVSKHDFSQEQVRISFIWREDRLWCNNLLTKVLKKTNLLYLALLIQNWKIQSVFDRIRSELPTAKFTVVGLGTKTKFPNWIEDYRVKKFDAATEQKTCQIYADSRLTIGVHGSNMLLPSAHAGMTIDILPEDRLGNFAQDILYQEPDPRFASFRYRYLSFHTSTSELANISSSMLLYCRDFCELMVNNQSRP
jgi:hypothetical protein